MADKVRSIGVKLAATLAIACSLRRRWWSGHAVIGGKPCDVAGFGVLRDEFDLWCTENETRLAL